MEKKQDLRITKTYMALTKAFLEMMEERPFEAIKVNELCDRALVRKSTFYKHFADKYELLAFIVRETQQRFDSEIVESLEEMQNPTAYYSAFIHSIFDFMSQNARLLQSAMKSNSFTLITNILSEQVTPHIRAKLREDLRNGYKMPASPEIMASFFIGAVMESAKYWLNSGKNLAEEDLIEQIHGLILSVYKAENDLSPQ